jgi:hypothetical protein
VPPSSRAPVIVFGASFLVVGVIFLFVGGGTFLEQRRYGARAPAVTIDKSLRRATSDTNTSYDIQYRVTPAEGPSFEQTESVDVRLWERVERGSPLAVEYSLGRPETARLSRDRSAQDRAAIWGLGGGTLLVSIALVIIFKSGRSSGPIGDVASAREDVAGSFWRAVQRPGALWFGGLFLLVGMPLFVVGVARFYDDWRFAREALPTQGLTLTKEIKKGRNRANREPSRQYEVTYRYSVNGESFEGRDELSADDWQAVVEREPIPVSYRPATPSFSHLARRNTWLRKTIFAFAGLLCTAAGCWIVIRSHRSGVPGNWQR